MGSSWDNQYDAFQGQSNFYDPSSSQYSYGDPSLQSAQSGNAYPNFMTPTDPYSTIDQQGNCDILRSFKAQLKMNLAPEFTNVTVHMIYYFQDTAMSSQMNHLYWKN